MVWCDPKPNRGMAKRYMLNLRKHFADVRPTVSLSDGYIKAVQSSKTDYLFVLEHDWVFHTERINHSLAEIMQFMADAGYYHLRFNQFENQPRPWKKLWDVTLTPKTYTLPDGRNLDYCITPCCSNNPHIIDRKRYIGFIKSRLIRVMGGSKGVEELMSRNKYTYGAIYGPLGHEPTIQHLDGRRKR